MRFLYLPLVLALLPAPASAQSLGEAARKEEERRQKNKEKGVKAPLFDDSKFTKKEPAPAASPGTKAEGAAAAAPAATPAAPAATASSESSASDVEAEQRKHQEEMWRSRMAQVRARRDGAKRKYDAVSVLTLNAGESYVDDEGRVVIRDLDHLREMVAKAKAEWETAEQAVLDLEESARRAGAMPGWLR